MSPHNVTNEQLVQFVLAELPAEKAAEIRAHLQQCRSCRLAVGRLKSLLDCAESMGALPDDETIVESANRAVLLAAKTQDQDQPRGGVLSQAALLGRTIMNHRMTKWAVAAVVALAIIAGLSLLPGDGAGKVYARMVDQLHNARTLTYSVVTRTGVDDMPTVRTDMAFMGLLPADTWRYAGQNVSFGDPATPIFWYQPDGLPTYRVIYADLHVADVAPESLPK